MGAQANRIEEQQDTARVIGQINPSQLPGHQAPRQDLAGDQADFLFLQAASPWSGDRLCRESSRVLDEIKELQRENRWEDILALFHPVEDKLPELADCGLADDIRSSLAFVLCRAGRAREAISLLKPVLRRNPENALLHYTVAYAALDILYTARNSRTPLPGSEKRGLLAIAQDHFKDACRLRPESVTFFYRYGILNKEIERKPRRAIPLFETAMANWEKKDADTQKREHQQYPKYIKAMYHLASCLHECGQTGRSYTLLERLILEDREKNHMHPLFKHYAMAKVLLALNRPKAALDHIETALIRAEQDQDVEYVHELGARCCLLLDRIEQAAGYIDKIPVQRRRPYIRWTEADVLVAKGKREQALKVLASAAERDRRGRHKALIRMAKIYLQQKRYSQTLSVCDQALDFCQETFGNPFLEAMFWKAAALHLMARHGEALDIVCDLEKAGFRYPHFRRLARLVRQKSAGGNRDLALVRGRQS